MRKEMDGGHYRTTCCLKQAICL